MKLCNVRRALATLLFLASALPAFAQYHVVGSITTGGSSCATATNCVVQNIPVDVGAVSFTVSANGGGNTNQFEVSEDGVNYVSVNAFPPNSTTGVTSSTANGTWTANVAGMQIFRVRCSIYVSGTVGVDSNASKAVSVSSLQGSGGGGGGGGDTITSPNSTLNVGGTSSATTLELAGSAGEIMAGATPALTYTPTLGKSGTAGTLSMFPSSGNFTTTWGSAATANNTILGFAMAPTSGDLPYCVTSGTTCTLTDSGVLAANVTTNSSNYTADGVIYATGNHAAANTAAGTAGQPFKSGGPGVAPTYQSDNTCAATAASDQISAAGAFATTCSVPNTNIGVGTVIEVFFHGFYATTATSNPQMNFEINAGGTTGACVAGSSSHNISASNTNGTFDGVCRIVILTTGSSGTAVAGGGTTVYLANGSSSTYFGFMNTSTFTFNTTTSETISLQETGTLVSGQTINLQSLIVRVIS